jgi:uncharacterized HhH-GPD family protein
MEPTEPSQPAPAADDPGAAFAFLVTVLFDHGVPTEVSRRAPVELRRRLGHLDPHAIVADPVAVLTAVAEPPVLHRYKTTVAQWVVDAAAMVVDDYGADTRGIWADEPTRQQLVDRLVAFRGIGPVKADAAIARLQAELDVRVQAP